MTSRAEPLRESSGRRNARAVESRLASPGGRPACPRPGEGTDTARRHGPAPDGVLLIDLGAPAALSRDLQAALCGNWEVIVTAATEPAPTVPLLDPLAAAFLVVERPQPERIAAWAAELRRRRPGLPLLIAAQEGSPSELARLHEHGVCDFVLHPFRSSDVHARVLRLTGERVTDPVLDRLKAKVGLRRLVGGSAAFAAAVERVIPIAACDANVLVTGETGTGKEVFARAIHHLSRRAGHPFVPVNCGTIPLELVENELFGHAAEAFTGAARPREGLIRDAEGGTLFLDEIDALPAPAQVKLLRFLQEKEYRALGSTEVRHADVRLIAATNASVDAEVERGRLRRDLYYRLSVLPLALPPLRERAEDVLLLAEHFLTCQSAELGRPHPRLTPSARQILVEHDWPGNVRELEHVVQRALLLAGDPQWIDGPDIQIPPAGRDARRLGSFQEAKREAVASFERRYVEGLLVAHCGNISHAARSAGKNRRAFFELIRKHAIDARRYRDVR